MTQITIPNVPTEVEYSVTSSSTGPFTVPFPFFDDDDVQCLVTDSVGVETTLVVTTDFTWTTQDAPVGQEGNGYSGGTITLNASIGADGATTLKIFRNTVIDRTSNYPSTGPFSVPLLNDEQNKHIMLMQEFSAEGDDRDALIAANTAAIESNDSDISVNSSGIAANTGLINALVLNPALSSVTLHDVRRYGLSVSNTGAENHAALIIAIATGLPLDFMEMYPMTLDGLSTIDIADGGDLHWYSSNGKGGLAFETRATPMTSWVNKDALVEVVDFGNILIDGLTITNPNGDCNALLGCPYYTDAENADVDIDSIIVRNCTVFGRFQMIHMRGNETVDPGSAWFGIHEVLVENNYFEDVFAITVYLRHMPTDRTVFRNNRLRNVDLAPVQQGISNGAANQTALHPWLKLMIIEDNSIINDIDFWSTGTSSYLCFVVFEGYEVVVKGNYMEGCKTVNAAMFVYLSYCSALHVTECDNIYLNNAHCVRATARNTLMKSKGVGIASSNEIGTRTYKNNRYTITNEWVTAIGKVDADICHSIYEFPNGTVPTNDHIEGNIFDLIGIAGANAATQAHQFHALTWINNQIKAQNWLNYLVGSTVNASIITGSKGLTDEETTSYICNNSFTVKDATTNTANPFIQLDAYAGTVVVKDNHVTCNVTGAGDTVRLFGSAMYFDQLISEGNSVRGNNTTWCFNRGNCQRASVNERFLGTYPGGVANTVWIPAMGRGSVFKLKTYGDKGLRQYFPWDWQPAELNSNYPDPAFPDETANKYFVRTKIKRSDATGWEEVTYEYEFYWSVADTNWRVAFTNAASGAEDEVIDSGVGVATSILLVPNPDNTASALISTVDFRNNSNEEYFRIVPDNVGNDNLTEIEIEVY